MNKIDRTVNEIGISRNRFIIKACEEALQNSAGRWPQDFFEPDLSASNLKLLKEGVAEMEEAIAISHKCGVITANLKHFERIRDLEIINWL